MLVINVNNLYLIQPLKTIKIMNLPTENIKYLQNHTKFIQIKQCCLNNVSDRLFKDPQQNKGP